MGSMRPDGADTLATLMERLDKAQNARSLSICRHGRFRGKGVEVMEVVFRL